MLERNRRWMAVGFWVMIVAVPVLIFFPVLRLTTLRALGRTYQCSLRQTLHSPATMRDFDLHFDAIKNSSRLLKSDDKIDLWHTRDGDFWIPKRNADTLFFNLAEQELDIYGTGAIGVQAGDVVLDCGANIGVFTRKALDKGARTVIAIEPAPENLACFRRNFAREIETGQVVVRPVGVWNTAGELPLKIDAGNSASDSFVDVHSSVASTVMVPLVTIDSLVADLALAKVDFIKLDIEGAEKKALSGAAHVMARFHPRLAIATEHLPDDSVAIPAVIDSMRLGYVTVCGPCFDFRTIVQPDVLYFIPG